ncbi:MAG: hypothetical protein WA624_20380 [Methylocella sp.]
MIGVDLIAQIRRTYREEPRPVKKIARTVPCVARDGAQRDPRPRNQVHG